MSDNIEQTILRVAMQLNKESGIPFDLALFIAKTAFIEFVISEMRKEETIQINKSIQCLNLN